MRWKLLWQCIDDHQHKAESAQLRESHLSSWKQISVEEVSVSLRRDLGGGFYVCLCVYGEDISSMLTEYIHHRLGWALICRYLCSTAIQSLLRCPSASLINWDAEQHKHVPRPFTTERLPVTLSGPRPNQPSSPSDNALWKPSPWELLHMLWMVVKETWLNNVPSCLSSPDSFVRSVPVFLRCENSCALWQCVGDRQKGCKRANCVLIAITPMTAPF